MKSFSAMYRFTLRDMVRDRSLYVMAGIGVLLILVLRGCLGGSYTVNTQQLDRVTLVWHLSRGAFHVVAVVALLVSILLTTGLLRRDRTDGSAITMLTRPVSRRSYVLARTAGVITVSFLFMFILHLTVFALAFAETGAWIPRYLAGSILCVLNIGFIVFLTALFSTKLPDIAAILLSGAVVGVSFVSEWVFRIATSESIRSMVPTLSRMRVSWWRMVWPKVGELQAFAVSLTENTPFLIMGPVHPLPHVLLYGALAALLLVVAFGREEL